MTGCEWSIEERYAGQFWQVISAFRGSSRNLYEPVFITLDALSALINAVNSIPGQFILTVAGSGSTSFQAGSYRGRQRPFGGPVLYQPPVDVKPQSQWHCTWPFLWISYREDLNQRRAVSKSVTMKCASFRVQGYLDWRERALRRHSALQHVWECEMVVIRGLRASRDLHPIFSRGHSANTPHSPFDIFDFSTPWLDRSVRLTGVGKNAATQSANMAPRHLYFWFEHGGYLEDSPWAMANLPAQRCPFLTVNEKSSNHSASPAYVQKRQDLYMRPPSQMVPWIHADHVTLTRIYFVRRLQSESTCHL
ncbi:hypothetical protein DFH94DRAFT_686204 [Russula ochroleuca]|uniref:Uncharacterized protein n=1 Tax=Russula ochroleuca TaxID=152965 RepID=A0A9P5MN54_9AGAM|nr:hypothetical protein DFH94DRAFT_686204 [Russula ochroleuca]